jgi:phospholipid/cholesterol/gamma-HCH transport system substrate-binding protein
VRGYSDGRLARIGAISLVVALVAMAAAMNLQKLPGFRGTSFEAQFTDASGLHSGNMVQIAGIRVGRVSEIELAGDHVIVHFSTDPGVEFGDETSASIEVLNLLGEKFLNLQPEGSEQLEAEATIPLARTDSSYDIVDVFTELSSTTEDIKIPQLQEALTTVADTMDRTSEEAALTFEGLSRLSITIASRDEEIQTLLARAGEVSRLLAERKGDIVQLIKDSDLILAELRKRKDAIHELLVGTASLSRELGGLVDDNQAQIGPMLESLREVTQLLVDREKQLRAAIHNLGPYTRILSNIIGTGPWFDAYASNLFAIGSGEFQPGPE